jgi:hypothetical protein
MRSQLIQPKIRFSILAKKLFLTTFYLGGILGAITACDKPPDLFGKQELNSDNNQILSDERIIEGVDKSTNSAEEKKLDPSGEENLKVEGAHIIRRPIQTDKTGIWDLEILLDKEKINKVNQRRDISKIEERPDLFGVNRDFEPLFTLKANKKGTLEISSKSLGKIAVETSKFPQQIEIYPYFIENSLFEDSLAPEEVKITFKDGESLTLIEATNLEFSRSDELFYLDPNLSDIISFSTIIEEELEGKDNAKNYDLIKNSTDLLRAAVVGLNLNGIQYEKRSGAKENNDILNNIDNLDMNDNNELTTNPKDNSSGTTSYLTDKSSKEYASEGYIKIRTPQQSKKEKKMTDIELCIWLGGLMNKAGMEPILLITKEKILLGARGLQPGQDRKLEGALNSSTINYIDPETLLSKRMKGEVEKESDYTKWIVDKSIINGNHIMRKEFEANPHKIFALDIEEWENIFRIKDKQ